MRLDTTTRYGFRLITNLAKENEIKSLTQIADEEKISRKYLEQIILKLRKKNIIRGFKGTKGGYILNQPPEKLYLIDIYRALEGREHIIFCLDGRPACKMAKGCKTKKLWQRLDDKITEILSTHTVADLLNGNI